MRIIVIGTVFLLNACAAFTSSQAANNVAPCPKPTMVYLPQPIPNEGVSERFNYHIRNIVADANTIKFQTLKQDFVFCRSNNTWIVQPGISSDFVPEINYDFAREVVNPAFKRITYADKTYQYRVLLEPNFRLNKNQLFRPSVAPEKDKVVLELITPNNKKQRKTLYTLKDLQQKAVKQGYAASGSQLGIPKITGAQIHGDRLWWSIAFEQGEGNNGIATLVGYNPKIDKFALIQPPEISSEQITDLVITGKANQPTFWMGTNISGEGNPYLPASGLVAYRANLETTQPGTIKSYNVHNSPLVGAIPDKLRLENDTLWVGTGNGVCKLQWQAVDNPQSWLCWRFGLMASVPAKGLPLYKSSRSKTAAATLLAAQNRVEVLWAYPQDYQTRKARYEVRYLQGFSVKLNEGLSNYEFKRSLPIGKPPVFWAGFDWHWNGERFVRGFDEVARNEFGGGARGINSNAPTTPNRPSNIYAIRGDLELVNISPKSTTVKYYSAWVDENLLKPYLTVLPQAQSRAPKPNPLLKY